MKQLQGHARLTSEERWGEISPAFPGRAAALELLLTGSLAQVPIRSDSKRPASQAKRGEIIPTFAGKAATSELLLMVSLARAPIRSGSKRFISEGRGGG